MTRENLFFETLLDNMDCGVYVLDDKGNFIFANRVFLQMTNRPRSWFNDYSVYRMLREGRIDTCISDLVYQSKKRINMLQKVNDYDNNRTYKQIVTSIPIFDENGNVKNILAIARSIEYLNYIWQDSMHKADQISNVNLNIGGEGKQPELIAKSEQMKALLVMAEKVASVDSGILIEGESGVGKNVLASYIHNHSNRKDRTIVEISCASFPEGLLEAELFGYEKGSFTGALDSGKRGLIEEADGGTLFLDEINSLPLSLQGKLLRAIETKKIRKVGSNKDITVDFRVIAATNISLKECVAQGNFRSDLYYRLNVVPLLIPPLRERRKDIIPLCMHFLHHYCKNYGRIKNLSDNVLEKVYHYDWPGNVRELRNFVERVVVMSSEDVIEVKDVPDHMFTNEGVPGLSYDKSMGTPIFYAQNGESDDCEEEGFSMSSYLERCENKMLEKVLKKYGSTYKAAEVLKMSQTTVVRRKEKYNIQY